MSWLTKYNIMSAGLGGRTRGFLFWLYHPPVMCFHLNWWPIFPICKWECSTRIIPNISQFQGKFHQQDQKYRRWAWIKPHRHGGWSAEKLCSHWVLFKFMVRETTVILCGYISVMGSRWGQKRGAETDSQGLGANAVVLQHSKVFLIVAKCIKYSFLTTFRWTAQWQ